MCEEMQRLMHWRGRRESERDWAWDLEISWGYQME